MEINKCMGCMGEYHGYPCPSCGYDPRTDQRTTFILPQETILGGKYLIGRVLGQGGFGITYIGWDIALERKVAIKEYYPSGQVSRMPGTRSLIWSESDQARAARQDGMQMFLKEARKMAKLEDIPGVVKVRDLFQENETAYIVMDFVEGKTLKTILKETGPMGWEQARGIFSQAIRSMELVHEAGLIHRDLSPDNLMITPNGNVKILDLGAAKDLNVNSGASSMQVAKHGFSPYEQYTQRGGSGPWTDVYAMAATIYYTLTGRMPPRAIDRVEEDTLRWDHPNLLALPAPAQNALKKAMVIMAKQRTQTMAELKQGLFAAAPNPEPRPQPNPEPPKPVSQGNSRSLADLIDRPNPQNVDEVTAPWRKTHTPQGAGDIYRSPNIEKAAQGSQRSLAELISDPNFTSNETPEKSKSEAKQGKKPSWKKRILALGIAAAILLSCLLAFTCGHYTYEVDGLGTVWVTGYVNLIGMDAREHVPSELKIPGTIQGKAVKRIASNAFSWCKGLSSVTIPDGVKSIGDYAFQGCGSLTEVTIPDSVTYIGAYAFYYCDNLTKVSVSANCSVVKTAFPPNCRVTRR